MHIVESGSLTKGYKSKFPLFHKLFLSRVEKGDGLAAIGLLWVATKKMADTYAKKTAPKGGFTIEWKNAAGRNALPITASKPQPATSSRVF